jgi:hypothetical protein
MGGTPYYTPRPDFNNMTAEQVIEFIEKKIVWLAEKKVREWRYLEKRRRKKVQTRTDDDYNADQPHEAELLAFLEHFKATISKV